MYWELYIKLFIKEKISGIVIYAPSNVIDRIVIAAAKHTKIPIFWVFHGISMKGTIWTHPDNLLVCSTGQLQKTIHTSLGANPNNLYITGPLFLERAKYFRTPQRQRISTILFCMAPIVEEGIISFEEYVQIIDRCAAQLQRLPASIKIIIKPHPLEKKSEQKITFYKKTAQHLKNASVALSAETKDDFYRLIQSSDLVLSFFSNSLFDTLFCNRPALMIELYDMKTLDRAGNFSKHSQAIPKIKPSELYSAILKFSDSHYKEQYHEAAQKMLKEWFDIDSSSDPPSTKIFDFIKETIKKK